MSKKAEERALKCYPIYEFTSRDINRRDRNIFLQGYELAEKDFIEKAEKWLGDKFFDNSHHSGRGDFGEIVSWDYDSMKEMLEDFRKTMEEE